MNFYYGGDTLPEKRERRKKKKKKTGFGTYSLSRWWSEKYTNTPNKKTRKLNRSVLWYTENIIAGEFDPHRECQRKKIELDRIKQARKSLFKTPAIGKRELNPSEIKDRRVFKHWSEQVEKYWKMLGESLVNVIMLSFFANCHLSEVRLLPSHRAWAIGALFFLMITFQRNGS